MLALAAQLEGGRHGRGQLDQLVVEKGHARFQAPGHGHVVHALDRVVGDEHRRIHAQYLVDEFVGERFRQMRGNELAGVIAAVQGRLGHVEEFVVIAVEVMLAEAVERAALRFRRHARIPEIAAEDFVRALAALHHFHRLRHLFGQEVEGHGILREHGLAHLRHRLGQALEYVGVGNQVLVVTRAVHRRHRVGILEFAAALFRLVFETDRKGHQVRHALFGE